MDYNQPYGASAGAPYVNGNPATGTQGSIPPGGAFEYPQREIVNLITDAGLAASNGDLRQLGKGIQGGKTNFAVAGGSANSLIVTLAPVPSSLTPGMRVFLRATLANTSTSVTLNVNGTGARSLRTAMGGSPAVGDLQPGLPLGVMYDQPTDTWVLITNIRGTLGGFDIVKQPYFFAISGSTAPPSNTNFKPSGWTVPINNLGDSTFNLTNGDITFGTNTAGLWQFSVSGVPTTTATNKWTLVAYGGTTGSPLVISAITTEMTIAGGFSPFVALPVTYRFLPGDTLQIVHYIFTGGLLIRTNMGGVRISS